MQKTCSVCGCLISSVYYTLDSGEVVCERDYLKTLDQCRKCGQPVQGKLVKLSGSSYHPECFSCQVIIIFNLIQENNTRSYCDQTCKISLVGVPFNVDEMKNIFCADCFKRYYLNFSNSYNNFCESRKFASSCSVCKLPILPKRGETVAARLRALGRDFHPECFKCEVKHTWKSKTIQDNLSFRIATKILTQKSLGLNATL